jgi:hypothetical protein
MNDEEAVSPRGNGRLPDGRFAPGNAHGGGSPIAKRMHEFRRALLDAGDIETLQALFRRLAELGLAGDTTAARLYLEYCCGKPVQALELSGPEGEPLGSDADELRRILDALSGRASVAGT